MKEREWTNYLQNGIGLGVQTWKPRKIRSLHTVSSLHELFASVANGGGVKPTQKNRIINKAHSHTHISMA